jgi:hypothetical protein
MQRNIPKERRPQPYAASVGDLLWQFHIEGLHVMCTGGSDFVNKQLTIGLLVSQRTVSTIGLKVKVLIKVTGTGSCRSSSKLIIQNRITQYTVTQFLDLEIILHPSYLSDLTKRQSQNSSVSQITQKVTAISVSSADSCLSAERRWRRPNPLLHFALSLNWLPVCLLAVSTNVLMRLLHNIILRPPSQFSCSVSCQLPNCL